NRHRIISQHDNSTSLRGALDGPVPFHTYDSVHDGEVRPDSAVDIENRTRQAGPVEQVLGPAIAAARHYPKHVLQRQGNPGPMMSLELGHGDHKVRIQDRLRKIKFFELGSASSRRNPLDVVDV